LSRERNMVNVTSPVTSEFFWDFCAATVGSTAGLVCGDIHGQYVRSSVPSVVRILFWQSSSSTTWWRCSRLGDLCKRVRIFSWVITLIEGISALRCVLKKISLWSMPTSH
jgi:hypothetical protein